MAVTTTNLATQDDDTDDVWGQLGTLLARGLRSLDHRIDQNSERIDQTNERLDHLALTMETNHDKIEGRFDELKGLIIGDRRT